MNEANKKFDYRGYVFNISVKFNTRVEKRINGDKWHTVVVNDMGHGSYYQKEEVNDKLLEIAVQDFERLAMEYIDKRIDGMPNIDDRLSKLGFS